MLMVPSNSVLCGNPPIRVPTTVKLWSKRSCEEATMPPTTSRIWTRQLHIDVTDLITLTKARYDAIKHWVAWVGKASQLQYSTEVEGCDHDKKDGRKCNTAGPKQCARIPTEARVIRRMPWASNSLGTIEYKEDLWTQDATSAVDDDQVVRQASGLQTRIGEKGSVAEKSYVDSFHNRCSTQCHAAGIRVMTRSCVNELSDALPTSAALGHMMFVTGVHSEQYFWCGLCSAYTGQRAQKLTKDCDRVTRKVKAVDRLRQGQHPTTGLALPSKPRRLCKRDVGDSLWNCEGRPSDPMHTDHDTDDGDAATVQAGMILSTDQLV